MPNILLNFRCSLATMTYRYLDKIEGENIYKETIDFASDQPNAYANFAADLLWNAKKEKQPSDCDKAISLLQKTIDESVVDTEPWGIQQRIAELQEAKKSLEAEIKSGLF